MRWSSGSVRVSVGNRCCIKIGKLQKDLIRDSLPKWGLGVGKPQGTLQYPELVRPEGESCGKHFLDCSHGQSETAMQGQSQGDQCPILTLVLPSNLCQGSLLAEPMSEGKEPRDVVHRISLLGRERSREGKEWIWLGKWELSSTVCVLLNIYVPWA